MNLPKRSLLATLCLLLGVAALTAADGRAVFANNCAACHGVDGRAQTPQGRKLKAHDLRLSKYTDAEIGYQVREGKKNKAGVLVMPAFGKDLSADEIKAVIETVKAFRVPPDAGK